MQKYLEKCEMMCYTFKLGQPDGNALFSAFSARLPGLPDRDIPLCKEVT